MGGREGEKGKEGGSKKWAERGNNKQKPQNIPIMRICRVPSEAGESGGRRVFGAGQVFPRHSLTEISILEVFITAKQE